MEVTQYVLVPVPEEHLETVQVFLARRATCRAPVEVAETLCDELAIEQLVQQLDGDALAVVVAVARAMLATGPPWIGTLADELDLPAHAIAGLALEVNYQARKLGGPLAVMIPANPAGPRGHVWDEQVLLMFPATARLVLTAAGASQPSPTGP